MSLSQLCRAATLLLSISLTAGITAETIQIAAEDDWLPYARADGTGLANEIIKAAFKAVEVDVEYRVVPYARALIYIEQGKSIAAFNVPLDEKSQAKYILGKEKLFDAVSAYYFNVAHPQQAKSRDELNNGELVGVVRDYGYGDHYLNLVKTERIREAVTNSESSNLKSLSRGRIDLTIIYDKTANILLSRLKLQTNIQLAFINETTPIYLAFSRSHSQGQYYADLFDQGMKSIRENGLYQKILDSY